MSAKRQVGTCVRCGEHQELVSRGRCNKCRVADTRELQRQQAELMEDPDNLPVVQAALSFNRHQGEAAAASRLLVARHSHFRRVVRPDRTEIIVWLPNASWLVLTGRGANQQAEHEAITRLLAETNGVYADMTGEKDLAAMAPGPKMLQDVIATLKAAAATMGVGDITEGELDLQPPGVYACLDGAIDIANLTPLLVTADCYICDSPQLRLSLWHLELGVNRVPIVDTLIAAHPQLFQMVAYRLANGIDKGVDSYVDPVANAGKSTAMLALSEAFPGLISYTQGTRSKLESSKWSELTIPLTQSVVAFYDEAGGANVTRQTLDDMTSARMLVEVKHVQPAMRRRWGTAILVGHMFPFLQGGAQGLHERIGQVYSKGEGGATFTRAERDEILKPASLAYLRRRVAEMCATATQVKSQEAEEEIAKMASWNAVAQFLYLYTEPKEDEEASIAELMLEHNHPTEKALRHFGPATLKEVHGGGMYDEVREDKVLTGWRNLKVMRGGRA